MCIAGVKRIVIGLAVLEGVHALIGRSERSRLLTGSAGAMKSRRRAAGTGTTELVEQARRTFMGADW
jgi:hypothetical protein